ncbi:hypothetical protein AHF37_05975 [Paragonimus kellicotti]|nr:hypothetical protein AHF37_05975 [Paragonimus kellicotti]
MVCYTSAGSFRLSFFLCYSFAVLLYEFLLVYISVRLSSLGACAHALGIPLIDSRGTNGQRHFFSESPFKIMATKGMNAGFHFLHPDKPSDCCAENPISFHYIEPQEIYFLDYLVHTACLLSAA